MYRTLVICRHTFVESVVQPIYSLLLIVGAMILMVFAALPFFTLGEDTVMFKAVGLDVILLLVLIATLFATSKSIFDEIEDRTMLTLMSKPVRKWEVLVGKYLGIILAAALAVAILGAILIVCTWARIPGDYQIRTSSLNEHDARQAMEYRMMHIAGLFPSLVLMWFQISVLAAIGVALSTRFSLVTNLPAVILIYIAGNLTRFLPSIQNTDGMVEKAVKGGAYIGSMLLPYLEMFDLRPMTVYRPIRLANTQFALDTSGFYLSTIWQNVATAAFYGFAYSVFALAIGMWMFQNRELGGAEG